jgi:YidC/Oxa1 family membrane protein insertase
MSLVFGNTIFGIPVDLAYHLVGWIAAILAPLPGGLATAAAIIAFTMLIRLLLLPLNYFAVRGSVRGEGARARLQPKIAELQRRHTSDPRRLQDELSALYRAEGSGMFGGCLPLLIQLPFLSVMYRLFTGHSVGGAPNTLLTHHLLAAPLGSHWLGGAGPLSAQGAVFAGLFVLLAAVAALAVRAARRATPAVLPALAPGKAGGETAPAGNAPPGRAVGVMAWIVPFASLVTAAIVPLAAGLYLLTTTAWTLAERILLRRRLLPAAPPAAAPPAATAPSPAATQPPAAGPSSR